MIPMSTLQNHSKETQLLKVPFLKYISRITDVVLTADYVINYSDKYSTIKSNEAIYAFQTVT